MSWQVRVWFQERGTRKEVSDYVDFDSKHDAENAANDVEEDLIGPADGIIVIRSAHQRLSFMRGDFRRIKIFEDAGPMIL